MSITPFAGETPAPLRGPEFSDAMLEILAITRWGELDLLVLDLPPGLGDATLESLRRMPAARYLAVTTPSPVVRATVARALALLARIDAGVAGIVENLGADRPTAGTFELGRAFEHEVFGTIPRDPAVDEAIGRPEVMLGTAAGRAVSGLVPRLVGSCRRGARR
jgi:ATP-binding protein involved in chromosome partitioning